MSFDETLVPPLPYTASPGESIVKAASTVNWDAHYSATYGPDGSGGCIADADPSDGIGRFPLLHGSNANTSYWGSAFADEMWDAHVTP